MVSIKISAKKMTVANMSILVTSTMKKMNVMKWKQFMSLSRKLKARRPNINKEKGADKIKTMELDTWSNCEYDWIV